VSVAVVEELEEVEVKNDDQRIADSVQRIEKRRGD